MTTSPGSIPPLSWVALLGAAGGLVLPLSAKMSEASPSTTKGTFEWRQLRGKGGPAARWDHTLAADDAAKRLVLFGGRDAAGGALDDTWLYDLADRAWMRVDVPGPAPRFGHAVTVDQKARRLILFGGQSGDVFYNDTWIFDLAAGTWTQIDTGEGTAPTMRYGLPAVLDGTNRFIISHGFSFEGRFDDTWALDLASGLWSEISPDAGATRPLKRCLHEMAWHPATATLLLYGGCSSGFGPCPQGDLWQFNPESRAWTELTPADGPAARSNPSMVSDRNGERFILIDGLTDAGYSSEIWTGALDGGTFTWKAATAGGDAPSPRASHDAVLTRGDVYLFGGNGDAGPTNDLWKLSLG
jgi:hypothetical protein